MTSRRSFIQSASLLSAGLMVKPSAFTAGKQYIGLQLYTVRDAMQADPAGTLARVAKIGFNSVEGATYTGTQNFYGMEPAAFKKLLKQNGLVMPSSHYMLGEQKMNGAEIKGTMLYGWDKAVDDAAEVGIKYMVCAYLMDGERGGVDRYKHLAEEFTKAAERCKKAGIQFCYHNHDFEFEKKDGQLLYDVILNHTDKDLVKMELDLFWVVKAGYDPIELFNQHPGRFPLWHVKDMTKNAEQTFAEVGSGSIDFKKIFKHANKAGQKYFFVEQDKTPGDPFESITKSIAYVKKNLV